MLMADSSLVQRIADNTNRFRTQMTKAGFKISGDNHPISPGNLNCIVCNFTISSIFCSRLYIIIDNIYMCFAVMLGDAKLAADFADDMLGKCFLYRFYYK